MRREIHSNHRLIVTPDIRSGSYLSGEHRAARALLDDMAKAVDRHVDHVGYIKAEWDTRSVCSFCDREWEYVTADDLDSQPDAYAGFMVGEPVCCNEASTEFRAEIHETGGGS